MAYLTALLPARDAIAVHTTLGRTAGSARNTGDPRGRGQLMADLLVSSVTEAGAVGATSPTGATREADATSLAGASEGAEAGAAAGATWAAPPSLAPPRRLRPRDVAVRLVMTDRALLDGDDEPAHLDGYGPVPAAWARDLVTSTLDRSSGRSGTDAAAAQAAARVLLTRLLTDTSGSLVAMDSRARTAPVGLADLIRTRDGGTCRTAWCDAPVRHVDHVSAHAEGGLTSAHNSQGLCEACNYTKTNLGWRSEVTSRPPPHPPSRHTVVTTTPTGHRYESQAPPLPGVEPVQGTWPAPGPDSVVELLLRKQLDLTA